MVKYEQKILAIGIAIIGLFIIGIMGLTYAFYTVSIEGNESATEMVVDTADLTLIFNDTQIISIDGMLPGASTTKIFTIENIGDKEISYDINIIDVLNTFINNELIYSFTSTNQGANILNTPLPTENVTLVSGTIEPGVIQTYTMTILFKENGLDQNANQNAEFTGKLQINTTSLHSEEMMFGISETLGTMIVGKTKKINIVGTNYGNVSCISENTDIADCTPTQKNINISGKAIGTTTITIKEDNSNMEATYTVTVVEPTVYNGIFLNNIAQSDASINFGAISSETNGKGLYYTADNQYGEDGERIYYFRGRVDTNWVKYANKLWRIVRTTSEGGVKLAYSGDVSSNNSSFISTDGVEWNLEYTSKYYVGYTFNTDLNGYSGTQTNSNIKTKVDTWYDSNINASNATYLSDTAIYCNDRSNEREINGYIRYPVYDRLICTSSNSACYGQMSRPTFACPSTNQSRYSVSTSTGNGYLQKPIALLNADEINYAGLSWDGTTSDSYIRDNTSTNNWWLMSPAYYETAYSYSYEFYARSDSTLNPAKVLSAYLIRGAVSLKSCITVSGGNGSKETPYVVSNASC